MLGWACGSMVVMLGLSIGEARAQSGVTFVALPTRSGDARRLEAHIEQSAGALARRLGTSARARRIKPEAQLGARLNRAHELAQRGALDEAAATFDAAIDEATHGTLPAEEIAALLAAHVERASIALAKGESRRAEALLDRLLSYDPSFALAQHEESPRLGRALAEARARAGDSTLSNIRAFVDDCAAIEVLLVGRVREGKLETLRFDRCVPTNIDRAPTVAATTSANDAPPRRIWWAPWTLAGAGLAVTATGLVLGGLGASEFARLDGSACGMMGTCDPAGYADVRTRANAGWGLVAAGGVVLGAGVIWGIIDLKRGARR